MTWLAKRQKQKPQENILKSDSRDLWPLRHLIRVMRRHNMTIDQPKDKDKDNEWWGDMTLPKLTMTMTMTFREHPQRATLETCDLSDDEKWPDQNWLWQWPWHLENTIKEPSWRLVTWDLTIETLITFLTIENKNLNIHSDSSIMSDMGQHSQIANRICILEMFSWEVGLRVRTPLLHIGPYLTIFTAPLVKMENPWTFSSCVMWPCNILIQKDWTGNIPSQQ